MWKLGSQGHEGPGSVGFELKGTNAVTTARLVRCSVCFPQTDRRSFFCCCGEMLIQKAVVFFFAGSGLARSLQGLPKRLKPRQDATPTAGAPPAVSTACGDIIEAVDDPQGT